LKIQKSDLFCVGSFFASSLFRAALTLTERCPDVRFTPKSGHYRSANKCPLCAKSGHQFGLEVDGARTLDGAIGRDGDNLQMSLAL
jgi:hypothetical protein